MLLISNYSYVRWHGSTLPCEMLCFLAVKGTRKLVLTHHDGVDLLSFLCMGAVCFLSCDSAALVASQLFIGEGQDVE